MMKLIKWALSAGVALILVSVGLVSAQPASAADTSGFNPGYIVSDENFYSGIAMSEAEIQAFLNARIGTCSNGQCLNVIRSNVTSRARIVSSDTGNVRCEAFQGGSALTAAAIIYRAQVSCGISAKVILVTLEKEQGLVTKRAPSQAALDRAMGFACPDTAPCAVDSLGFANQIYKGTLQLKTYKASRFGLQPGVHAIQYKPFTSCGAPAVNVLNYATAALYNYTPYQPNAAALANPNGVGDACSSYGNRNFFVFYSDWFGSPTGPLDPVGSVNEITAARDGIKVRGWAFDYSTNSPIKVDMYLNGRYRATLNANLPRPDVAAAYPGRGADHGFASTVSASPGSTNVCLYGVNVGPGKSTLLGCSRIVIPVSGASPVGDINSVSVSGTTATIRGWTFDSDTAASIRADLWVDGRYSSTLKANLARPDVQAAYPSQGPSHGFQAAVTLTPGAHQLCAYGINSGGGANRLLGCRTANVSTAKPVGDINTVKGVTGAVEVRGWTFEPRNVAPIVADVYIDGAYRSTLRANQTRIDVQQAYPGQGPAHGFSGSISAATGSRSVCIYGINPVTKVNSLLGCRLVNVPG